MVSSTSAKDGTVAIGCRRCAENGIAPVPTLALVGEVALLRMVEDPVVFVRAPRTTRHQAARASMAVATAHDPWRMVLEELAPLSVHGLAPNAPTGSPESIGDTWRPSFAHLAAAERRVITCPRGHRVQVTRAQIVRWAERARDERDRAPTI